VKDSDGTLIISPEKLTGGTLLTVQICNELKKPVLIINPDFSSMNSITDSISRWISSQNIVILNVGGPRKSEWNEGYQISYQLIKNLVAKIEESNRS
jgi:hypothetical protein